MNLTESKQLTKAELWLEYRPHIIKTVCEMLNVELFDKQETIVYDTHPEIVIRAGRRASKSFSMALYVYALLFFGGMFDREIKIGLVGPTFKDARYVWNHLMKFLYHGDSKRQTINLTTIFPDTYRGKAKSNTGSDSNYQWHLSFENGTSILTGTGDLPGTKGIRGEGYDFIGIDEFGFAPYQQDLLSAAKPALMDKGNINELWIIGSPNIGLSVIFDDEFDKGQKGEKKNEFISSYKLTSRDNPHVVIDGMGATTLSLEGINREIEGRTGPKFGRMFEDWQMEHIVDQAFDKDKPYITGIDPGLRKPVVEFMNVWFEEGDEIPYVHIFSELAPHDQAIDQLIDDVDTTITAVCQGIPPVVIGVDKAGDAAKTDKGDPDFIKIQKKFHQARKQTKGWAVSKNNQVKLLLILTKVGHLTVDSSCKKMISSLMNAQYDTNNRGEILRAGWKKKQGHDDPLDALAYALVNYGPTADLILKIEEPEIVSVDIVQQITGQIF